MTSDQSPFVVALLPYWTWLNIWGMHMAHNPCAVLALLFLVAALSFGCWYKAQSPGLAFWVNRDRAIRYSLFAAALISLALALHAHETSSMTVSQAPTYPPLPTLLPLQCADMTKTCFSPPLFISEMLHEIREVQGNLYLLEEDLRSSGISGFIDIQNAVANQRKANAKVVARLLLVRDILKKEADSVKLRVYHAWHSDEERRWAKAACVPADVAIRMLGHVPINSSEILCELGTDILGEIDPASARLGSSVLDHMELLGYELLSALAWTERGSNLAHTQWYETSPEGFKSAFYYWVGRRHSMYQTFDDPRIAVAKRFLRYQHVQINSANRRYESWGLFKTEILESRTTIQSIKDGLCKAYAQEQAQGFRGKAREMWRIGEDGSKSIVALEKADWYGKGMILYQMSTLELVAYIGNVYQRPSEALVFSPPYGQGRMICGAGGANGADGTGACIWESQMAWMERNRRKL